MKYRTRAARIAAMILVVAAGSLVTSVRPGRAAGPSTTTIIDRATRAYFAAMVRNAAPAVYTLLAPCAATVHLHGKMMGLPARGVYHPTTVQPVLAATINKVTLATDPVLAGTGMLEARADGQFRFNHDYPGNQGRADGHHVIPIVFIHCGGQWRLFAPWGTGGPITWK